MDELKKFFGKPKTYTIEGEEFEFYPLKGKDLHLIVGMKEGKEAEGMVTLVSHYLKTKYPTVTPEMVDEMSAASLSQFIKAIYDVNGIGDAKDS